MERIIREEREGANIVPGLNPLPQRYLTDSEGIGGHIKERPEDFLVDELPLFEPEGTGEHLYLRVRKIGLSHGDMTNAIAAHFGVSPRRIGHAGMKDKQAVTVQSVTVQTERDYSGDQIHPQIEVQLATRHTQKLRRGQLGGNRFSIFVRGIDNACAPTAVRIIHELEARGVPNFFGSQRFGYRCNNHRLGVLLLKRQWDDLLMELLGTTGAPVPQYQRAAREAFEKGDFQAALRMFPRGALAERATLRQLAGGHNAWRAALAGGRRALSFWANAAQSAIFNRILDQRITDGSFEQLETGDLAWKHDSGAVFAVDEQTAHDPSTIDRLAALEISPSGPLWGKKMTRCAGAVDARELAALEQIGLSMDDFDDPPHRLAGSRRPLRIAIRHPQVECATDERGDLLRLAFDLPRGSYATIVLREILKPDAG